jgi:N-acetyl-gamma-glutamyl-phosphate reductase
MGVRVAVAGASGYAGGELLRLIAAHPVLELGPVTAGSNAGAPVTAVHPHLAEFADRTFEETDPDRLASADLVFLALHHEQSAAIAARLPAEVAVIDLSASFRLFDPGNWAAFYRTEHAGRWVYGLPELPGAREQIVAARRVAAPGCYATAIILALTPLLASGVAEPDDLVVVAASGTSGAGRTPTQSLLATEVMGSVSAYQVGGVHRHTPEIEQAFAEAAGVAATVSFTPLLAPMPRGILATCTARLAPAARAPAAGATAAPRGTTAPGAPREALASAYASEPFICVLPEGHWPSTASTAGSNAVHLQATADAHAGRAVVVAALDNLVKGAAGQAVQIANLMLGLPEAAGLTANGVAP